MSIEIDSNNMKIYKFVNSVVLRNGELFRFLIVGGIAVFLDGISYVLMVRTIGVDHSLSKRISFVLGSIWAFLANKHYTFSSSSPALKEVILFTLLYLSTYLANGWVHDITWEFSSLDWFSFLTATATSTTINYVGQKFVVFRKSR